MDFNIGSRGSSLALRQTEGIVKALREQYPDDQFHIVIIKTKGDKNLQTPLHEMQDKGLFVQELEHALLDGKIHMAVHSMKDMPSEEKDELCFPITPLRVDPRDIVVWKDENFDPKKLHESLIGTGSKRRSAQLKHLFPQIRTVGIRGNIETRMGKIDEQGLDGVVLAAAGMIRGGHEKKISYQFSIDEMVPSPCQGILALQTRHDNTDLIDKLKFLHDESTFRQTLAERSFLKEIGAGCHAPVGAYCKINGDDFVLYGVFGDDEGKYLSKMTLDGKIGEEAEVGIRLAKELKKVVKNDA